MRGFELGKDVLFLALSAQLRTLLSLPVLLASPRLTVTHSARPHTVQKLFHLDHHCRINIDVSLSNVFGSYGVESTFPSQPGVNTAAE